MALQLSAPAGATPALSKTGATLPQTRSSAAAPATPAAVSTIGPRAAAVAANPATARDPLLEGAAPASGTPAREPGAQQRLGQLQQGMAYVEQLRQALQTLKNGLGQALARPQADSSAALAQQLGKVQTLWQARGEQAAGVLDGQLQPVQAGAQAQQRFTLRGLDIAALSGGSSETLRLSLPGQTQGLSVPLDGRGLQRQLNTLRQALAPTGVTVDSRGGELSLSVAESRWPALRDGLSIRGEGKRFPSGQPVRAALQPQADAMAPAQWKLGDAAAQRDSLRKLLQAQQDLAPAAAQLQGELAQAQAGSSDAAAASPQDVAAIHNFAADFATSEDGAPLNYERLAALSPALAGLHRRRVEQLLQAPA
ncbi:MAG: hypothetical protein ABW005_08970 [Burkholderiaceae bacterium]